MEMTTAPSELIRQAQAHLRDAAHGFDWSAVDVDVAVREHVRFPLPASQPVPAPTVNWTTVSDVMRFLLAARDPDEIARRAAACLAMLPWVAWASYNGFEAPSANIVTVALDARADSTANLQVCMAQVDADAKRVTDDIITLACEIYSREVENRRLAAEAQTDPLTGLRNRRGFEPFVDQALARAARSGERVTLMLFDLDHFKGINDTLGHDAGDRALRTVAESIEATIRPTDMAARLGGDELAVLLTGSDADGATAVADRIRALVAHANPLAPRALTLSVGIADDRLTHGHGPAARKNLMRCADEALYFAKEAGRDRATVHPRCRFEVVESMPVAAANLIEMPVTPRVSA